MKDFLRQRGERWALGMVIGFFTVPGCGRVASDGVSGGNGNAGADAGGAGGQIVGTGGTASPGCKPAEARCANSSECCDGYCVGTLFCDETGCGVCQRRNANCTAAGAVCRNDSECCEGRCDFSVCTTTTGCDYGVCQHPGCIRRYQPPPDPPPQTGGLSIVTPTCTSNEDCCFDDPSTQIVCYRGSCTTPPIAADGGYCAPLGFPCSAGGDCCSGTCTDESAGAGFCDRPDCRKEGETCGSTEGPCCLFGGVWGSLVCQTFCYTWLH